MTHLADGNASQIFRRVFNHTFQRCTRASPHEIHTKKTLLRSLHVAQAVVYRCYTDIDIVLSFRFLCFVYCCITIIIVMVVYDFQSPLSRITMITQTLLLLLILVLLLFCFYLLLFHQLELVF